MISCAIWKKHALVGFSKATNSTRAILKFNRACFFQIALEITLLSIHITE